MKLLVDINVVLDVILEREPWSAEAALLFSAIQNGNAEGWLAGHSLPTVHYIVRQNRDRAAADVAVALLLRIFGIVCAEKPDVERALTLGFGDFEDAVQAACAARLGADHVVTRDVRGFRKSPVPPVPAGAVLAALGLA